MIVVVSEIFVALLVVDVAQIIDLSTILCYSIVHKSKANYSF